METDHRVSFKKEAQRQHDPDCSFRRSMECRVECAHGYDLCPICDPCTCKPDPENLTTEETE